MSGRLIPFLALLITLATIMPVVRAFNQNGPDVWQQTESQIDRGLRNYFDRQMRLCQF